MSEKIYGSNGLPVPMPKISQDASGIIPFDKDPQHIEDAKNTLAKAAELLKSEDLSFDKKEKLQAAMDDLDIAVECDADDEFEVGNKARALRKVIREFSGAEIVAETKAKQPDKKTLAKVKRIVSTYDKIASKGLENIPADVQIKMANLKTALNTEGSDLKAALNSYIESLKLARAWRGTNTEQVVAEAAKPKGENAGQVADIGTLASRMVSPKEVSTTFNPRIYTVQNPQKQPEIVFGGITVKAPLTLEEKMQLLQKAVKQALTTGDLHNYLQFKIGDKISGLVTLEIEVNEAGRILVNPDFSQADGIYIKEPDENKLRLATLKLKLVTELEYALNKKIKFDPPKDGKAYTIILPLTLP